MNTQIIDLLIVLVILIGALSLMIHARGTLKLIIQIFIICFIITLSIITLFSSFQIASIF